jgi:hypothetical protein
MPHRITPLDARSWSTAHARIAAAWLSLVSAATLTAPTHAQALSAGGGLEYCSGASGQVTRSVDAWAEDRIGAGAASLDGSRFSDSVVGTGISYGAGLGVPVAPVLRLRAWGTRYVGDGSFSGWRLKGGPQLHLASGETVGFYASRYDDDMQGASTAVTVSLAVPRDQSLSIRANAGYASAATVHGPQATAGASWIPIRHLELSGDFGFVQSGLGVSGAFPSKHPRDLAQPAQPSAEIGVRFISS